jgi:hypothetical protein
MTEKDRLIEEFEKRLKGAEKEWEKYKMEIGETDGPMASTYISVSRWIIEDRIEMARKEVSRWKAAIGEVKRLTIRKMGKIGVGSRAILVWPDKEKEILVTESVEDFGLGLLPKENPLVKLIWGKEIGEAVKNKGVPIRLKRAI